jgi:hypothetical protein
LSDHDVGLEPHAEGAAGRAAGWPAFAIIPHASVQDRHRPVSSLRW